LKSFQQARWEEPLLWELSLEGRSGCLPPVDERVIREVGSVEELVPDKIRRKSSLDLPELTENMVVRHFVRLSQMTFCVDTGMYPLGSCTMKYTPKAAEAAAALPGFRDIHPLQHEDTVQGALRLMYELQQILAGIAGLPGVSLQPPAGAAGEFAGCLIIRKYFEERGEVDRRTEMLIPDSAHGTNPASAAMAGFEVVVIPSGSDGLIDLEALKATVSERTAGIMLTNPNTLGLFEKNILDITRIVHEVGGLVYYDGANLNAIMGWARPGDMGVDIMHFNLHKTFGAPHGGGGPGSGPIAVSKELEEYLPVPVVAYDEERDRYYLDYNRPKSIGKVHGFFGNFPVLVKAYVYIRLMGRGGLKRAAAHAVLASNYLARRTEVLRGLKLSHAPHLLRKHEFVLTATELKAQRGVTAGDIAKRILDFGLHAPTMYFPLIVKEALMVEPTETEPLETLDSYAEVLSQIVNEAWSSPEQVKRAPYATTVRRVDEVRAARPKTRALTWRDLKRLKEKEGSI